MYITYRDEIGTIIEYVSGTISVLNGKAYFTTDDDNDRKIDLDDVIEIGEE